MTVNQFLLRGGLPGKQSGLPIECGSGGAKVHNNGPRTVYYRDEQPVSATVNDGSIGAGATATLFGNQFFVVDQGVSSSAADTAQISVEALSTSASGAAAGAFLGLSDVAAAEFGDELFPMFRTSDNEIHAQAGRSDFVSITDPMFGAIPDTGSPLATPLSDRPTSDADWTAAQQNMWRVQAAMNYVAATAGKATVLFPPHTFRFAFPRGLVQTTVTVDTVTPQVVVLDDASGFPDPAFMGGPVVVKVGPNVSVGAGGVSAPTFTYTGKTATTLTGVTAVTGSTTLNVGDMARYGPGFIAANPGYATKDIMILIPSGVRMFVPPGCVINVDVSRLPDPERGGRSLYTSYVFGSRGTQDTRYALARPAIRGEYWLDVPPSLQPNASNNIPGTPDPNIFPGVGSNTNTYQYLDRVLVGSEQMWDPDNDGNRIGEILVVDQWQRTRVNDSSTAISPAATTLKVSAQNGFQLPPLPAAGSEHATTISGAQSSTAATLTVGSTVGFPLVGELDVDLGGGTYALIGYTGKTATTFTGCTSIDGAVVTLPDTSAVQWVARFLVVTNRHNPTGNSGMNEVVSPMLPADFTLTGTYDREFITCASASGNGISVVLNNAPTLNIKRRGALGTTAVYHYDLDEVWVVPPPGRVNLRTPLMGGPYYPRAAASTDDSMTLTVAAGTGDTSLTVTDAGSLPNLGRAKLQSETIAWTYRDARTLYGVTRGLEGTTAATHAVGIQLVELAPSSTITTSMTAGSTAFIPIDPSGAGFFELTFKRASDPDGFGTNGNYVTIDDEIIYVTNFNRVTVSGSTLPKLAAPLAAVDMTVTVDNATNLAASGQVKIQKEIISYSSKTGNVLNVRDRGAGGTAPAAASSGTSIFQITSLAGITRGVLGTTAAAHSNGAPIYVAEGGFISKLTMNTDITVEGGGTFQGRRTYSSRAFGDRGNIVFGPDPLYASMGGWEGALKFTRCERVRVKGLTFQDVEMNTIRANNTVFCLIQDNFFDGSHRQGLGGILMVGEASQDHVIANNTFQRARHSQTTNDSDGWGGPRRIMHIGNHAKDMLMGGYGTHPAGEHHDFLFNTIEDCGEGIQMQMPTGRVIGNTIRRCANGILVTTSMRTPVQMIITDNIIENDRADGISVLGAGDNQPYGGTMTAGMFIVVANNTMTAGAGNGIRIDATPTANPAFPWMGVTVTGNRVSVASAGIVLGRLTDFTLTGNVVRDIDNGKNGYTLTTCTDGTVTGNTARGRYVGTSTSQIAYSLVGCTALALTGNRGTLVNKGLVLDNASTFCTAFGNILRGCTTPITRGSGTGHVFSTADGAGAYNF